jgi:phosphoglycolate phosphatase-like HAD superfamily hydrolase
MKLVLFDIDGTLISHVGARTQIGFPRFEYAIKKVYGVDITFSNTQNYAGMVDYQIVRSAVPQETYGDKAFDQKWPQMSDALYEFAAKKSETGKNLYAPIKGAVTLARILSRKDNTRVGFITGNVKKMGQWKLACTGILSIFPFGIYSDKFKDRIALVRSVFDAYEAKYHEKIAGEDVTIIGDTVYDVRCGKAIGARTIAVTAETRSKAGIHVSSYYDDLKREHPDLLVQSLMDRRVLDFFKQGTCYYSQK